jgi:hypothetical protein
MGKPNNACKWQMRFNSAFKGLNTIMSISSSYSSAIKHFMSFGLINYNHFYLPNQMYGSNTAQCFRESSQRLLLRTGENPLIHE